MQRKLNEEFIKDYSEEFAKKIGSGFFKSKHKISGKEIISVSPSRQVNFFILKILFHKWQEEMKSLESPYFDYKNPEVKRALMQFMNTLSQYIEVSREHFLPMVEEAVADTLLLAADPAGFLAMEFDHLDVIQVNEKVTKPIFKYIKLHKEAMSQLLDENEDVPLDDALENIEAFFEDQDTGQVLVDELESLSQVVRILETDLFIEDEEPDFFDEPVDEDADTTDTSGSDDYEEESGRSFFDDDLDDDAFVPSERAALRGDSQSIMEDEFAEDSDHYDFDQEEEPETFQESREQQAPVQATEAEKPTPVVDQPKSPLVAREPEVQDESVNEKFAQHQPTINDRFSAAEEEEDTLADKLERKKVNSVMEAISVNHRYMFTKELFDGDRDAFIAAVDKIEECKSFDNAVEMLVQQYARTYHWNMNSDEVKDLLKVVFRKFR